MISFSWLCSSLSDLLHVYKNRLQQYTQKKNLPLPDYSYEFDGPPHARLFRGSVVVEARTYQSQEYYPTLKDAEHAAAKVALEFLSLGDIQEASLLIAFLYLYKCFLDLIHVLILCHLLSKCSHIVSK